ncbi:MAG TPA: hypothetical protein VMR21_17555 [Vicinamibacteria bacterium]|nr:hypothetical protein [Vicinamibacteria bacterium]
MRTGEVLRAVREHAPGLPLTVVASAEERVCRRAAGEPVAFRRVRLDVGVVQGDALSQDEAATAEAWARFHHTYDERVAAEARWLRESGTRLVLADVPPLAFDAAARAGVPAVALTNFSWDWVYRHLARREPRLEKAADHAARAYGQAELLLELPFAGDLSAFPRRERIPLVARPPRRPREEVRRHLGLGERARVVLVTFGGIGVPGFDLRALALLSEFTFLATEGRGTDGANVRFVDLDLLDAEGYLYRDLVTAADVVLTKPGYGIVTDAIASGTRIVYTERGDFPEYPILAAAMADWIPSVHVSNDLLRAGHVRPALEGALALALPPLPPLDGAGVAARRLLEVAGLVGSA